LSKSEGKVGLKNIGLINRNRDWWNKKSCEPAKVRLKIQFVVTVLHQPKNY
jgi:hypothetical protein